MSTLIVNPVPLPYGDALTKPRKRFDGKTLEDITTYLRSLESQGYITDPWSQSLDQLSQQVSSTPTRVNSVSAENQQATIVATDLASTSLAEGLYEIRPYARIVQAATTSSSLTLAIGWTENGVLQSKSFAALTGNTTTTVLTDPLITVHSDEGTPITYTWTYASVGGVPMKYRFDLVLARVAA